MEEAISTVLINGKIYTCDGAGWEKQPAEAMAFNEKGNIVFVGSNSEALQRSGKAIIDLNGRSVLPGFIDGHVHAPGTAFAELYQISLNNCFTVDETLKAIRSYVEEHQDLDIYFGSGFNMGMVDDDGNPPCAKWLDEICPDKPMVLRSYDLHSTWFNSKAMEVCGRGIAGGSF